MNTNKAGKRNQVLVIITIIIGIAVYLSWSNSYVEFKPIVLDLDAGKYVAIKPQPGFNTNLKVALKEENIAFKEDASGKIFIRRKIKNDKELVWNLTTRAMDTAWLNSHRGKAN